MESGVYGELRPELEVDLRRRSAAFRGTIPSSGPKAVPGGERHLAEWAGAITCS